MRKIKGPDYVYQPLDKLPSYAVVKALYMGGATYVEIGALYHVRWNSVQGYLERQARRHGDPWPFDRVVPRRPPRFVDGGVITDLIREALEVQGISACQWSNEHGVGVDTVNVLLRTPVHLLRLDTAKRLLVALGEPVPKWIEDTLRARASRRHGGHKKSVALGVSRATDSEVVRNLSSAIPGGAQSREQT